MHGATVELIEGDSYSFYKNISF